MAKNRRAGHVFLTMQATLVTPVEAAVIVVSGGLPLGKLKVNDADVSEAPVEMVRLVGLSVPVTELRVRVTVRFEA